MVNSQFGERQEFIKKYEADVIDVKGRQIMLEKEQDALKETDKQNDLKINGGLLMIEALQYEIEQIKNKLREQKA